MKSTDLRDLCAPLQGPLQLLTLRDCRVSEYRSDWQRWCPAACRSPTAHIQRTNAGSASAQHALQAFAVTSCRASQQTGRRTSTAAALPGIWQRRQRPGQKLGRNTVGSSRTGQVSSLCNDACCQHRLNTDTPSNCVLMSIFCRSAVVGKVSKSIKDAAGSIIPASKQQSDEAARPTRVVREDPPDVQLRTAVRGT